MWILAYLANNKSGFNTSQQGSLSGGGDDTKDGYNETIDIESDVHNYDSINTHQPISSVLEDDITWNTPIVMMFGKTAEH